MVAFPAQELRPLAAAGQVLAMTSPQSSHSYKEGKDDLKCLALMTFISLVEYPTTELRNLSSMWSICRDYSQKRKNFVVPANAANLCCQLWLPTCLWC